MYAKQLIHVIRKQKESVVSHRLGDEWDQSLWLVRIRLGSPLMTGILELHIINTKVQLNPWSIECAFNMIEVNEP